MQNLNFNHKGHKDLTTKDTKICFSVSFVQFLCVLCGLFFFMSCGNKRNHAKAQKKIEITITGLDGNGIAEKTITNDLMALEGIKTISFNYLNNQVVVLFDTTIVKQADIISIIMKSDKGKHKVLDVKTSTEPIREIQPIKPDPQEDIQDDIGDQYKDNG